MSHTVYLYISQMYHWKPSHYSGFLFIVFSLDAHTEVNLEKRKLVISQEQWERANLSLLWNLTYRCLSSKRKKITALNHCWYSFTAELSPNTPAHARTHPPTHACMHARTTKQIPHWHKTWLICRYQSQSHTKNGLWHFWHPCTKRKLRIKLQCICSVTAEVRCLIFAGKGQSFLNALLSLSSCSLPWALMWNMSFLEGITS